jgi:hypothetical protein
MGLLSPCEVIPQVLIIDNSLRLLVVALLPCLPGRGAARKDLSKLQPLREHLQQQWQEGVTSLDFNPLIVL